MSPLSEFCPPFVSLLTKLTDRKVASYDVYSCRYLRWPRRTSAYFGWPFSATIWYEVSLVNQTTPLASPALYVFASPARGILGRVCRLLLAAASTLLTLFSSFLLPTSPCSWCNYIQRWGREHETNYEVRSNYICFGTEMLLIPLSTGSYKKTCIIGVSYNNIFMTKHYNNVLATHFPHRYLYLGVSIKH